MLLHKKEFFGNGFFTADHVTVCGLLVLFLCYFGLYIRTHVERLYDFAGLLKNVTSIIDAARKNSVEVIYVQHDDGPGTCCCKK